MPPATLRGTTQNDIVKEYLSRGTYIFPPEPSRRLIVDMVAWCAEHAPMWNPMNVCSYHLQEAGRDAGAGDRLRAGDGDRRARRGARLGAGARRSSSRRCSARSRSSSTPASASSRRSASCGRSPRCGTASASSATASTDAKARRFRYGVQVNSLGLTEAQPENNVQRIVLEMLGVTLSKRARARCVQLPAWNEALGLPRPWDQQWSLRMQQVLAFETDLLEYDDLFDGSHVDREPHRRAARRGAGRARRRARAGRRVRGGRDAEGAPRASMAERTRRIESGDQIVVGVNRFTETDRVAARRRRRDPHGRPGRRGRDGRRRAGVAGRARRGRGRRRARRAAAGGRRGRQRDAAVDRPGPGRRHDRRVGRA